MNRKGLAATACVCVAVVFATSRMAPGGDLNPPPGPPQSSMPSLAELYNAVMASGGGGGGALGPVTAVEPREECYLVMSGVNGSDVVPGASFTGSDKAMRVVSISGGVRYEPNTGAGGGGVGGQPFAQSYSVIKRVDKATPVIMQKCATGDVVVAATLYLMRDGAVYATIEMDTAVIIEAAVEVEHNGVGGFAHLERVTLSYDKLRYRFMNDAPMGYDFEMGAPL